MRSGDVKARGVLQRWTPAADALDAELEIGEHLAGAVYYVRLRQANTIRGRAVYAWSSPIWTVP